MNFIIDLFIISNEYNSLITIIDRFNKYVRLISKKKFNLQKNELKFIIILYFDFEICRFK